MELIILLHFTNFAHSKILNDGYFNQNHEMHLNICPSIRKMSSNNDIEKISEQVESRELNQCEIENCLECKNTTCLVCSKGFKKVKDNCVAEKSDIEIDSIVLTFIIFGTSIFSILFCILY